MKVVASKDYGFVWRVVSFGFYLPTNPPQLSLQEYHSYYLTVTGTTCSWQAPFENTLPKAYKTSRSRWPSCSLRSRMLSKRLVRYRLLEGRDGMPTYIRS